MSARTPGILAVAAAASFGRSAKVAALPSTVSAPCASRSTTSMTGTATGMPDAPSAGGMATTAAAEGNVKGITPTDADALGGHLFIIVNRRASHLRGKAGSSRRAE